MFDILKELIRELWEQIKKIWRAVLNFVTEIVNFFKNPERLKKIKENKNLIAVSVKENLANGNYNVVNCLFDEETDDITSVDDMLIIQTPKIDFETKQRFGNRDMIKLQ